MKIAIDLRSLSSGSMSGVENYTASLLEYLLPLDRKNEYILFYNSFKPRVFQEFNVVNSEVKTTRWPNKVLNGLLKLGVVKLESFTGPVDWLFLPNLNQFSIRPETKLAITVHDLSPVVTPEFYDVKRRLWHTFLNYKKSFERANIIFAVSEHTKFDLMRLYGVPEQKIKVVYPGVTPKSDISEGQLKKTRNELNLPGRFVLFLSTIEPRKNLHGLIESFEKLEDSAHLVIIGRPGWKYGDIFERIIRSPKRDKIHYKGYVSEKDKHSVIKLSQAVIYPSFYEGFGFVPLEAMQLGVPVVASNVTSIPEICRDAALLVNPYNTEELTYALKNILNDLALRTNLIEKGHARVKDFNWNKTAEQVIGYLY